MMSKALARTMSRIDNALVKAMQIALVEIEREARRAIDASPAKIKAFVMARGRAAFTVELPDIQGGEGGLRSEDIAPGDLPGIGHNCKHAANIDRLLSEYNKILYLTGYPLKLERDGTGDIIKLREW